MRDPKRIQKFCSRLARAWETLPDWRFGQLMVNALGAMNRDPFFPEDDEMIEYIESYVANSPYRAIGRSNHDAERSEDQ